MGTWGLEPLGGRAKSPAKKISAGRRPVSSIQPDPDVEVAFAREEFAGGLDGGLGVEGHELALMLVDFGLVGGVNLLGFSPAEGQVTEALFLLVKCGAESLDGWGQWLAGRYDSGRGRV